MQRRPLGATGIEVSTLAFGAAPLGGEYGSIDVDRGVRAVRTALDAGIDLLDTAPYYGRGVSEVLLGIALQGVPRDRYVLCTKLGRYGVDQFDFSPRRVVESVDTSLYRLRTDHLDIVICHDVEFVDIDSVVDETLPALRSLVDAGKVRAIGVSGYPLAMFRKFLARADVDVVLSYANYTLQNRSLRTLLPLLAERGIGAINAAPFDMRLLTDLSALDWHPAPPEVRKACKAAAALCRARGADIGKLAFQFSIRCDGVASTLVGSADPAEVAQWIAWSKEPLDEALLADVERLLLPVRDRTRVVGRPENNRD